MYAKTDTGRAQGHCHLDRLAREVRRVRRIPRERLARDPMAPGLSSSSRVSASHCAPAELPGRHLICKFCRFLAQVKAVTLQDGVLPDRVTRSVGAAAGIR
jgi:hypothetical protein